MEKSKQITNIIDLDNLNINQIILLNNISDNIKNDYNKLIKKIYKKTNRNIDWHVNSVTSRHTYFSDIFLNVCYLLLIKKLLEKNKKFTKIIIPNKPLKKVLEKYLKKHNFNIKVILKNKKLGNNKRFKRIIKNFYNYVNTFFIFLKWLKLKDKTRQKIVKNVKNITLIDTFFLPSMFKKGRYKDRYYNNLLSYLPGKEKKKIFFVPTLLIKKNLKQKIKMAEDAEEQFIYKFDFLKFTDYIYALFSPFRIKKINFDQFTFHGFKIGPILKDDFDKNITNISSFRGILNYLFFKRLKENDVDLRLVVDWFENQVIDRGFNKGVHTFYPNIHSIGYQGFIISTDYNFYIQPTKYESINGVIPDEIAVVGKGLKQVIKKYNEDLNVSVAPAFRFQGVWKSNRKTIKKTENIALVALPISLKESIEIIQLILNTIKSKNVSAIKFQIKPHPSLNVKKLKDSFKYEEIKSFEFIEGDFNECVAKSDVMLGNTSSTCLETLSMGIPVIILGSQSGLTQNPIPETVDKNIWRLCYTAEDLSESLNYFLNFDKKEKIKLNEIGEKIKKEYFEPVTNENVQKFLKLSKKELR